MSDALMLSISGCRGVVGTSLTPEVATRFAGAVGRYVVAAQASGAGKKAKAGKKAGKNAQAGAGGRPLVVVGRDGRAGGEMIKHAAVAGLLGAGCDVLDVGVAMTPTVGVLADEIGAAGLVLTASHNPQQWNGIKPIVKLTAPGAWGSCASAPDKGAADAIIKAFGSTGSAGCNPWNELGTVTEAPELVGFHGVKLTELLKDLKLKKKIEKAKFRAVVDSVNASGVGLSAMMMDVLGVKLTHLGNEASGLFPHTPEPTRENLADLCKQIRKNKAHVGLAQDPDADRLAVIDENGRYIGEEYTLVLCAMALIELGLINKGDKLVVNLSTSRMLEDVANSAGAHVVRSAVGEANVVAAMKHLNSPFGGEGNGGVIWPAMTFIRDSLSGMALVLGLMALREQPLSEIVDEIPTYAIVKRKVDLASKDAAKPGLDRLAKHFASHEVDRQDGVRIAIESQRAWLHVRASNTEPIMRLIAEAPDARTAEKLLDEAGKVVGG